MKTEVENRTTNRELSHLNLFLSDFKSIKCTFIKLKFEVIFGVEEFDVSNVYTTNMEAFERTPSEETSESEGGIFESLSESDPPPLI